METGSVATEIRTERFSNGLEITASHVRLGDQTWAVGQIKKVGICPVASGIGMIVCGALMLLLILVIFGSLRDGQGEGAILLFLLAIWCGYGVWASWNGLNSAQVWLQTGMVPTFIFQSRDIPEAQRVKELLERAIAQHTPAN